MLLMDSPVITAGALSSKLKEQRTLFVDSFAMCCVESVVEILSLIVPEFVVANAVDFTCLS